MFDIDTENNIIIKDPAILLITEFKKIWDKDKSKSKVKALKDFAYIYLKNDFKSTYRKGHTQEELPEVLKRDLNLPSTWKPTQLIKDAEEKYSNMQITKSLKMLIAAETAMEQITKYFNEFQIEDVSSDKKALSINKLMSNLKEVDDVVTRIEAAKTRVERELNTKKLSGTKRLTSRELPKNRRR